MYGGMGRVFPNVVSKAAGTKVLQDWNESRSYIVTGPGPRLFSVFRLPGIVAAGADLRFPQLDTAATKDERNLGKGNVDSIPAGKQGK